MPGDFERSPGLSLPSGRTALKRNLQPLCPVKLYTGSFKVTPCPLCWGEGGGRKGEDTTLIG